jgi:hypothetical protein
MAAEAPKALHDPELQAHYDQLFAMYGTRGWARLMEQVKEMVDQYNSLARLDTIEQLWFRKGQLDNMLWLLSHRDTHEAAYNELLAQQEGGDALALTGGAAKVVE